MTALIRRTLPAVALAVALAVSALVVLGTPDPAAVSRFFAGEEPDIADAEAVVSLITWVVIAATAIACLAISLRALTTSDLIKQRSHRAALACAAGVLLVGVALIQRSLPVSVDVCCGDALSAAHEAETLGAH